MDAAEYKTLHAEWYDLISAQQDHSPEIEFWMHCISQTGGPVLELGSGTGRVLVPLLERGVDVVGVDNSVAMMARCQSLCREKELTLQLYEQSMLELNIPITFGLVMLTSGGLGLFVGDADIQRLFERIYAHLKPGGQFIYEFEQLPLEPKETHSSEGQLPGSNQIELRWQTERKYDLKTHIWKSTFTIEKFSRGKVLASEVNQRAGRYFERREAMEYALAAGFVDVVATAWLTDEPLTDDAPVATVRCGKPD